MTVILRESNYVIYAFKAQIKSAQGIGFLNLVQYFNIFITHIQGNMDICLIEIILLDLMHNCLG